MIFAWCYRVLHIPYKYETTNMGYYLIDQELVVIMLSLINLNYATVMFHHLSLIFFISVSRLELSRKELHFGLKTQ